jgi:uncharacterized protein YjbI with pentapeptide repeats
MTEQKRRGRPPAAKEADAVEVKAAPSNLESVNESLDFVTHYEVHKASGRRPRFSRKDFNGLHVLDKEVPAADFHGCSFEGATFERCNLQGWVLNDCIGQPKLIECDTRFSVGL